MTHRTTRRHLTQSIPLVAVLAAGLTPALVAAQANHAAPLAHRASPAETLHADMRKLWEDHVTWTRLYIVSAAAALPDKEATAQRLLLNQADIGNAVKPFYGEAAGDALTLLLRDHILGAAALIDAAKAGDATQLDAAKARWYQNSDDIAKFLSDANPKSWPLADLKAGMRVHLDLTLEEAVARLEGRFADDIRDYDAVRAHILGFADLLAAGLVQQFPQRFAS